jgi:hypothetical protein
MENPKIDKLKEETQRLREAREAKEKLVFEKQLDIILLDYTKEYNKNKYISLKKFAENIGRSDRFLKKYLGNLNDIDALARKKYPEKFNDIVIDDFILKNNADKINEIIKNYNRFFIISAVTGCLVNTKDFKTAKGYCEKNNALLLILVCSDPAHKSAKKGGYGTLDKRLQNEVIVTEDMALNSNFLISTIKMTAKQIDPVTGLNRLVKKGSLILASPKQRLIMQSTSNTKYPRAIMTSGSITNPDYNSDMYMSARTAYLAESDHVMGGIIVEIENDKLFHYRQVQFDGNGNLADWGKLYNGNTVKDYSPEAIVPGDWHCEETDELVSDVIFKVTKDLKIKKVILNDVFTGSSISPHEREDIILRAIKGNLNKLSLEDELKLLANDLNKFTKVANEVIIVKSNHDVFLDRYLRDGMFVKDPQNFKLGLELSSVMCNRKDPLKYAIENKLKNPNKIRWLKIDEDYKIAGIQFIHGHLGANGSKGSLANIEKSYGKSISGHSHSPAILRDAWVVGTSTRLRLEYNKGPSNWFNTFCLVYPNGQRQLINILGGKYKLNK